MTAGICGHQPLLVEQVRDRLVNPLTGLRLHLEDLMIAGSADPAELQVALDVVARLDGELDRSLAELRARLGRAPAS